MSGSSVLRMAAAILFTAATVWLLLAGDGQAALLPAGLLCWVVAELVA